MDDFQSMNMCAEYYDTPAHMFNEQKQTFRIRNENDVCIATFKSTENQEGSLFTREEYSCSESDPYKAAEALVAAGAPESLLSADNLINRCRVVFTRERVFLRAEDTISELALDAGTIFAEDKKEEFAELEIELISGPSAPIVELAARLQARYDLKPELYSKYDRALRLLRSR